MALNSNFRTLTADNIEGLVDDRNYLKSSFENGTTHGWTEVSVALTSGLPTGTPTISSTAAPSIFLQNTATTPLSGARSLLVVGAGGLTAGHGFISDEFTLDRMDLGKVLTVSFDYELVSGTLNFSGTLGSQTLMVYIYDATAGGANWIQPAGFLGMNQSSGPGRVSATFQSSVVAGQKYRVAVIASQAVGSACSLEFDNFTCSRVTAPIGPVVTDWVSYTPTGSWTSGVTYSGKWRRVGDSLQASVKLAITGGVTATDLQISIPSGLSIDTTKMASADFLQSTFGTAHGSKGGLHYNFQIGYASTTLLFVTYQNQLSSQVVGVTNTSPVTWASGDVIHATFMAPIQGWSSSVQMSNDTDTRVVAFSAFDGGTVNATNTTVLLPFGTTDVDTHAARSLSNTYVIPVSGFYRVSGKSTTRFSVGGTTFNHALLVYKNGVAQNGGDYGNADGSNTANLEFFFMTVNHIFRFNAGDVIDLRYFTNYTAVASTYLKEVSIERLSGPSVIAANETVAFSVNSSTTAGSTAVNLIYSIENHDTHDAYSTTTGKFTCPVSGKYFFGSTYYFGATATAASIYRNGIAIAQGNQTVAGSAVASVGISVNLLAGDVIEVRPGAPATATAGAVNNTFYGVRTGN